MGVNAAQVIFCFIPAPGVDIGFAFGDILFFEKMEDTRIFQRAPVNINDPFSPADFNRAEFGINIEPGSAELASAIFVRFAPHMDFFEARLFEDFSESRFHIFVKMPAVAKAVEISPDIEVSFVARLDDIVVGNAVFFTQPAFHVFVFPDEDVRLHPVNCVGFPRESFFHVSQCFADELCKRNNFALVPDNSVVAVIDAPCVFAMSALQSRQRQIVLANRERKK